MTERRERRRPEFSFDADPLVVERQIRGARLIVGEKSFVIRNAEGFLREENETGQYRTITTKNPGELVGLPFRKAVLPLIATRDGSCILLRSLEITEEGMPKIIKGPGKVSKELGLEKGNVFNVIVEDPVGRILRVEKPQ